MRLKAALALVLITLALGACSPVTAPQAYPMTSEIIVPGWQVYTNPGGFAFSYPPNWTVAAQPDMTGTIHAVLLQGPEGEVEITWGTPFGTVCPSGTTTAGVTYLAGGPDPGAYVVTCYSKNVDGTESWLLPAWGIANGSFMSYRAATRDAQPASRAVVLQVASTMSVETGEVFAGATPTPVNTYLDPFSYCTAARTIDVPDARYTGPQTPGSILPAGPWPFAAGSATWRCMDGSVYACYTGANIPCGAKADTSTTPNEGMANWCKDNPNAATIPDVAAGKATIYAWSCKDGVPVPGQQVRHVDAQGYIAEYWQPIPSQFALRPAVVPGGWDIYTNPGGFAISYPSSWTVAPQPDANGGALHTDLLQGPEGEVALSWGTGFGGACPGGYSAVAVAQGDIQACYAQNPDGTESWTQMSHQLAETGFQSQAATRDAQPASHATILQVLSTLTFDPGPPPDIRRSGYPDPYSYCAALGMLDYQDARYLGPQTPDSIAAGLQTALAGTPTTGTPTTATPTTATPAPFPPGSVYWRCMGGSVYACAVGANIPCWSKADTSAEPSADMQAFCKEQPGAGVIPAYVTGRETVYAWSCQNGVPVAGQQVHQVDPAGYIVDYWQAIPSPAQPAGATPVPTPTPLALLQPLSDAECTTIADTMAETLGVPVTTGQGMMNVTTESGYCCWALATGTGQQFKSPEAVVASLGDMLAAMGFMPDPQLTATGATGSYQGYRKGSEVCWAQATWWPSPAANCPAGQLLSDCDVPPAQQDYSVKLNCAQSPATPTPTP